MKTCFRKTNKNQLWNSWRWSIKAYFRQVTGTSLTHDSHFHKHLTLADGESRSVDHQYIQSLWEVLQEHVFTHRGRSRMLLKSSLNHSWYQLLNHGGCLKDLWLTSVETEEMKKRNEKWCRNHRWATEVTLLRNGDLRVSLSQQSQSLDWTCSLKQNSAVCSWLFTSWLIFCLLSFRGKKRHFHWRTWTHHQVEERRSKHQLENNHIDEFADRSWTSVSFTASLLSLSWTPEQVEQITSPHQGVSRQISGFWPIRKKKSSHTERVKNQSPTRRLFLQDLDCWPGKHLRLKVRWRLRLRLLC